MELGTSAENPDEILLSVEDEAEEETLSAAADSDAPLMRQVQANLAEVREQQEFPKSVRVPLGALKPLGMRVIPVELGDPESYRAAHKVARVIREFTG